MSWESAAACRGMDPALFVAPVGNLARASHSYEVARAVCADCPVRGECLDDATTRGEQYGMWGGLDEHQRRGRAPRQQRQRRPSTKERALELLDERMSTSQVADRLQVSTGTARQAMLALHRERRVVRSTHAGHHVWGRP